MSVSFDEIPLDWLEPAVFVEIKPNYRSLGVLPYPEKALIAGQKLVAGTLAPGQFAEITRADDAIALFGLGSIGAEMVAAFKKANKTTPLFVTALPDAGGAVKATGTFTFTGAVSLATVLRFKVAGQQVRITALPTDTVTQLAAKLVTAITADTDNAVTATAAVGVVTCTAKHGGEVGNEIDIRVDTKTQPVPNGLTIAVVGMAGGTGNPLVQTVLDAIANTWFTKIVTPWNDATNVTALTEWLRNRYLATSKLDVHGFGFKRGTYGQLGTFGALTNSPFFSAPGLKNSPTSSWAAAASLCGIAAFHLTNDPARQLRSLVLPGVEAPDALDQFTDSEQDLLLRTGVSTLDCLSDGSVVISRIITTYKVSSLGVADRAWLDIMVPVTMSRIRYDWSGYFNLMYPRSKLIDDDSDASFVSRNDNDSDPGTAVVSPKRARATWAARCRLYADKVWIEDEQRTINESYFERNADDRNRMDCRLQIRMVGNQMVLASSLEFQV